MSHIIMPRIAQESSKYLFPLWSIMVRLSIRPAPMSVYNGILRSYFLLGTKISFASNNDEKIVDPIYMFSYYP